MPLTGTDATTPPLNKNINITRSNEIQSDARYGFMSLTVTSVTMFSRIVTILLFIDVTVKDIKPSRAIQSDLVMLIFLFDGGVVTSVP
eukprot:3269890-Pyramimonas_sp.AAC.1